LSKLRESLSSVTASQEGEGLFLFSAEITILDPDADADAESEEQEARACDVTQHSQRDSRLRTITAPEPEKFERMRRHEREKSAETIREDPTAFREDAEVKS